VAGSAQHPRLLTAAGVLVGFAAVAGVLAFLSAGSAPSATGSGSPAGPATPPATSILYPAWASATRYTGLAIDVPCTAPSLAQLQAWAPASPYHAIGVSISGVNRICPEPFLTAGWVAGVTALGWRILPLDQGLQAPCSTLAEDRKMSWDTAAALAQGRSAGAGSATAARALGMVAGSAVYTDMESYPQGTACQRAVLSYLSGWTQALHYRGFLAGVYSGNSTGTRHLSGVYYSTRYTRPDAAWNAWYAAGRSLTGWPGIPGSRWPEHQRIRQYHIGRFETYGGVTLKVDDDNVDAPVATVPQPRTVSAAGAVAAHSGPGDGYPVVATYQPGARARMVCRAAGGWDKLAGGAYLRDSYLHAQVTPCWYPDQVNTGGALLRSGPVSGAPTGRLAGGALAWIVCQQAGDPRGATSIWDEIAARRWASDRYVATPSATSYSPPIPHC
jgi:hypothetical protein